MEDGVGVNKTSEAGHQMADFLKIRHHLHSRPNSTAAGQELFSTRTSRLETPVSYRASQFYSRAHARTKRRCVSAGRSSLSHLAPVPDATQHRDGRHRERHRGAGRPQARLLGRGDGGPALPGRLGQQY